MHSTVVGRNILHEPVGLFSIIAILVTGTCSICSAKYTYGVDGCTISVLCSPCMGDSGVCDVAVVATPTGSTVRKDDDNAVALFTIRNRVSIKNTISHLHAEVSKRTAIGSQLIDGCINIRLPRCSVHALEYIVVMALCAVGVGRIVGTARIIGILRCAHKDLRIAVIVSIIIISRRKAHHCNTVINIVVCSNFALCFISYRIGKGAYSILKCGKTRDIYKIS